MPLDPSIPLQYRGPQISMQDLLSIGQERRAREQQRFQIRSDTDRDQRARQEHGFRLHEFEQRKAAENEEKRFKSSLGSLLQANMELGPEGQKLNEQGFVQGLANAGFQEKAYEFDQKFREKNAKELEAKYNKARMESKRYGELFSESAPFALALSDDTERANILRERFKAEGLDFRKLPEKMTREEYKASLEKASGFKNEAPASVQEWGYYQSLPDAKKDEYLEMKRGLKFIDTGDELRPIGRMGRPLTGPDAQPLGIKKGLKPGELPSTKAAQAAAEQVVKEGGKKEQREESEFKAKEEKANQAVSIAVDDLETLATRAENLSNNKNLKSITGVRGAVPDMPGSGAADARADLKTLVSQSAISTLSKLKASSATGSTGFGALSEKEMQVIIDAFETLQSEQSEEKLKETLKDVAKVARKNASALRGGGSGGLTPEKKKRLEELRAKKAAGARQ